MKDKPYRVEWSIIQEPIERFLHQLVLEYIKLSGDINPEEDALKIFNLDHGELDLILDGLHDMGYIKRDFITQEVKLI